MNWSNNTGLVTELVHWVIGGSFCCKGECDETEWDGSITSGYGTCSCGSTRRILEQGDEGIGQESCVSDGREVSVTFFVRNGEFSSLAAWATDGSFCCSSYCVEAFGGSATVQMPVIAENGEPVVDDNNEPVYETWGDGSARCICGQPDNS